MLIEYSLLRISLISNYVITKSTLILSLLCKRRSLCCPAIIIFSCKKTHLVRKIEIYIAIVSQSFLFGYNNDGDFVSQHVLRKRFGAWYYYPFSFGLLDLKG